MLHIDEPLPPVFVDPSGDRRRRLRRLAYIIGALLVLVLLGLWFSQLSASVPPPAMPCTSAVAGSGAAAQEACPR